jgi:hypothetical protein
MATVRVLFGDDVQRADAAFYTAMSSLEVEENADLPGAIQLTLGIGPRTAAGAQDLTILDDPHLQPYARIAVVVSVDRKPDACIFDGYVLSHKVHLDRGTTRSTVQVWGQDVSCLMNLEDKVHEWTDTDGTIANTIFRTPYRFQTSSANTEDDSGGHPASAHTVMQRGTDAQFLRDRARRTGRLFRVACDQQPGQNTGYFIKPKLTGEAVATLVLNPHGSSNVERLDFEWDVARPTEVLANALATSKDALDGGATQSGLALLDNRSLATFAGTTGAMKVRLTATVDDASELRTRAESLLREAGWFVKCEGEADLARLGHVPRVGTVVQVNGAGKLLSGKYLVWSVRHTITGPEHRMKFVLVRNAVGAP